jgi:GMP synthase (glutamine-hydrolysing)
VEKVLVLDFGSQYTKLIAKSVRELGVYSEIIPHDTPGEEVGRARPKGLILSGGPASVYQEGSPLPDPVIFELGVPILGICYGMHLIARHFGGRVKSAAAQRSEYGHAQLEPVSGELFQGLGPQEPVWMSHGDMVEGLPPDLVVIARSESLPIAAIQHKDRQIYGIQFHPEVTHTPRGKDILKNFLVRVCKVEERWEPLEALEEKVKALREQLSGVNCIVGVSGGVDSSTAAVLVHRAIGERLIPVYIDTGLMRQGEGEHVRRVFDQLGLDLHYVEAQQRFFNALDGVIEPEEKRRRVGEAFIRVFEQEARRLQRERGEIDCLVQGTIYSDVIESAGARGARRIKSHHNVGGLPQRLGFRIVEPLREFFKDEVRRIAERLELPREIIWEQPFPGPGLAVRIIGEVTPGRVAVLRAVDAILRDEFALLQEKPWQYFAVLLPLRSVAILGDQRGYGWVVAIRSVHSVDGMTADWFKLPFDVLERCSSRITNEVGEVTRVVYDITSKPPGTIEWQ